MPIPALPDPPTRADPGSFNDRADAFLAALPAFVSAANALEQSLQMVATTGTSASTLAISTGTKEISSQGGKAWVPGTFIMLCAAASPSNYMVCQIGSYDTDTGHITADAQGIFGTGSYSSWVISLSAPYHAPVDLEAARQDWINDTYEVGDFIHTDGRDPNERYPWQTWELIGPSQTLVNIDVDDETMNTVGLTLGSKSHLMTVEQMPPHAHDLHVFDTRDIDGSSSEGDATVRIGDAGKSGYISESGGGQAFGLMQPSRVTKIWQRTA